MLSYSAITNKGKITLPSVDSWGTNLNILKDPPKSIHTRLKTVVGANNDVLNEVDDSANRIGEYINVYARGVNPFVSVSYSNTGTTNNGSIAKGGQTHAMLPYRIMRDGAFRPPIYTQEDLLPGSRLPRVKTEAKTNIINVDFSKKVFNQDQQEKSRQIKEDILHTFVRPTAVYKLEKPQEKTYDVKFSIKEVIQKGAISSGFGTKNIVQTEVKIPTAEIITNNIHANVRCNVGDTRRFINNNQVYTENYIQDSNSHSVQTNIGSNKNYVSFDSDNFDSDRYIQDSNSHSVQTNLGTNKNYVSFDSDNFDSDRYIQDSNSHSVQTNLGTNKNYVSFDSDNFDSDRYIQDSNSHSVQTNLGTNKNYVSFDSDNFDSDRYIQDVNVVNATTNPTSNKHYTLIDEIADLSDLPVKANPIVVSRNTPLSKQDKTNYIHSDIELERNMPEYSAVSSKSENIYKMVQHTNEIELERNTPITSFVSNIVGKSNVDNNSKDARLNPKIQAGSFSIPANIPKISRNDRENIDNPKSRMIKGYNNDANMRFNMQSVRTR
jgi:hypothetical protein